MTVVKRERKDNFAILPNAVANDERISFEARGMLVYLLAKPNDWQVNVDDLRRAGNIGRDKTYRILNELLATGYIERRIRRDGEGRIEAHEYVVYDDPVPDQLPLAPHRAPLFPEKPEVVGQVPENPEVGQPLPGKPYPAEPDTVNQDALLRTESTKTDSPLPPHPQFDFGSPEKRFEKFLSDWPAEHIPSRTNRVLRQFLALSAEKQAQCVSIAPKWRLWMLCTKRKPKLDQFFGEDGWHLLFGAPEFDRDGLFIIKPGSPQWEPWMDELSRRYGVNMASAQRGKKFFLAKTPLPARERVAA